MLNGSRCTLNNACTNHFWANLAQASKVIKNSGTQTFMTIFYHNIIVLNNISSGVEISSRLQDIWPTFITLLTYMYFVYSSVLIYWTFTRFIRQCPAWLAVFTPLYISVVNKYCDKTLNIITLGDIAPFKWISLTNRF